MEITLHRWMSISLETYSAKVDFRFHKKGTLFTRQVSFCFNAPCVLGCHFPALDYTKRQYVIDANYLSFMHRHGLSISSIIKMALIG